MRKTGHLKVFGYLSKNAYKISKEQNLGWTWADAQKWASKNIYPKYKSKTLAKVKDLDVDSEIKQLLNVSSPISKGKAPKIKEVCFNPFHIPSSDLEDTNWWMIADDIERFDPNLNIAVEIDGFINTGIIKKKDLPSLVPIREQMRKGAFANVDSSGVQIIFKILVAPNKKDDGKPCSYYILVTIQGSPQDIASANNEKIAFVSEDELPEGVKKSRELAKLKREEEQSKKKTKKEIREKKRPSQVQAKLPQNSQSIELEAEKFKQLNRTLEILREDYKDGLISKKQYQARQQTILNKFENGGTI